MRGRAVVELVLAVLAAVGAVISWVSASSQVAVAPILEGEPATVSQVYSAPLLTLSLLLAAIAGVLAVLGGAGLFHSRTRRAPRR
ncbi:hypothetical protein [Mycobacterium sp. SMC-4]|uniref:hypothetical protein n=1 Tax=Mycobacterium sp. SMC-4 TaxID=2857059 RepID=UPI003D03FED6